MIAALVAAACMPVACPPLGGVPDAAKTAVARQGAEHRHQTGLLREFRIKINLALRRLDAIAIAAPAPTTARGPAREEDAAPAPGPFPYKGLEAFQPEDAEWFFGRDQLVAEPAVRLSETPFLAVL